MAVFGEFGSFRILTIFDIWVMMIFGFLMMGFFKNATDKKATI